MHGQAVLQAVHAAGVFRHVAADGAGNLAAGVGRVVQAVGRSRLADGQVAHPALHPGGAAERVHIQNFVEFGQRQRHPHGMRHGPTRQARARAPGHYRHLQAVAHLQHGLHLGIGLGQRHDQRALAVGGQAVAFVGGGLFALPQQGVAGQVLAQGLHHFGLAGQALRRRWGFGGSHHGVTVDDATGRLV